MLLTEYVENDQTVELEMIMLIYFNNNNKPKLPFRPYLMSDWIRFNSSDFSTIPTFSLI